MPTPLTHALVPLAAAVAFAPKPFRWRLFVVAALAAAAPDLDGLIALAFEVPRNSIYEHRGAGHSLFVAIGVGLLASCLHQRLGVRRLTAGLVVAGSVASHGLLDMMTDMGAPIAYLWPLSSARLFADWRPIHSTPVEMAHLLAEGQARLRSETLQIILPLFASATVVRLLRLLRVEPFCGSRVERRPEVWPADNLDPG